MRLLLCIHACILLSTALLMMSIARGVQGCACTSRLGILEELYHAAGGGGWSSPWVLSDPEAPCSFVGVTCSPTLADIVSINLRGRGLRGGPLPSSLANLTSLAYFDVSTNALTGTLSPSFASWVSVTVVNVSNNQLSGSLPPEYSALPVIEEFYANLNRLTGTLPPAYGRWTKMSWFRMGDNMLTGTLPPEYSNWTIVTNFFVGNNSISGTLPPEYKSWVLDAMEVHFNNFSGTLPIDYQAWGPGVHRLVANNNHLSGTLPPEYKSWATTMGELDLQHNSITGTLPKEYGTWSVLHYFNLYANQLSGSLPPEYGAWGSDPGLNVNSNSLTGTLPVEYKNWTGRINIDVHNNLISGTLPVEYSIWANVISFNVQSCRLTGTLPPQYAAWGSITTLGIGGNQLTGSIPPSWGDGMRSIQLFFASYSNFTGTIPPALLTAPKLQFFAIAFSSISGSLPMQFSPLLFLLDVQNNTKLTASPAIPLYTGITACGTGICPNNAFVTQYCFPEGFVAGYVLEGLDLVGLLTAAKPYIRVCSVTPAPTPPPPPPHTATLVRAESLQTVLKPVSTDTAAAMIYTALVVGGSMLTRGTIPSLQRASSALHLAALCNQAGDDSSSSAADGAPLLSDLADNPLFLQFPSLGGPSMSYAAGAVVGNAVLVVGIGLVLHAVAMLEKAIKKALKKHGGDSSGSRLQNLAVVLLVWLPSALLPGAFASTYGTMLQPSLSGCIALIVSEDRTAGSVAYAVVMLILWCALPVYCSWVVLYRGRHTPNGSFLLLSRRTVARSSSERRGKLEGSALIRAFALMRRLSSYWLDSTQRWHRPPPPTGGYRGGVAQQTYVQQAEFLLENMEPVIGGYVEKREWYFAIDWGLTLTSGCVLGAAQALATDASSNHDRVAACDAATWGTVCALCWSVAQIVICVALRPLSVRFELHSVLGIGLLGVVSEVLLLLNLDDAADGVVACANIATVIAMVILMLHVTTRVADGADESSNTAETVEKRSSVRIETRKEHRHGRQPGANRPGIVLQQETPHRYPQAPPPSRAIREQLHRLVKLACDSKLAIDKDVPLPLLMSSSDC